MASHGDDDLVASKTAGFKVGEKKTVAQYTELGEVISLLMTLAVSLASSLAGHVVPTIFAQRLLEFDANDAIPHVLGL